MIMSVGWIVSYVWVSYQTMNSCLENIGGRKNRPLTGIMAGQY